MFKKFDFKTIFLNKKFLSLGLIVNALLFYFILLFFFGEKGIINLIINYSRMRYIESQVEDLQKEKQQIIAITKVENTQSKMELKAREDLGLIKPGEKVIIFSPTKK